MPKISIKKDKCKGCYLCIGVCPKASIELDKDLNIMGLKPAKFKDNAVCIGCKMCAVICPDCAIEIFKEDNE